MAVARRLLTGGADASSQAEANATDCHQGIAPLNAKTWLVLGGALGALAVALGAFGAHGLPAYFELIDLPAGARERLSRMENWEIAARYHMYHALAVLLVGLLAERKNHWLLHGAGLAFFFGTLIFSGMLYALAITGARFLGAIVPIGGVLFLVGWVLVAAAGRQFVGAKSGAPTPVGDGPSPAKADEPMAESASAPS
jgi:uncharacterized membrane protein YgdD (TMEM256/DUF423 family)